MHVILDHRSLVRLAASVAILLVLGTQLPLKREEQLIAYKGLKSRVKDFAAVVVEFVVENGAVEALNYRDPSGEYVLPAKVMS